MDRKNGIDWGGWILTVIMLGALPPVGLILLFRQLMGYNRKSKQVKRHPYDVARDQQAREYYARTAQQGAQNFTQGQQTAQGAQGGSSQEQYRQSQWYTQQQAAQQQAASRRVPQGGTAQGNWNTVKSKSTKRSRAERKAKSRGTALTVTGGILSSVFGLGLLLDLGNIMGYGFYASDFQFLMFLLGFFGAGIMCLFAGANQRKKAKRYKKYLAYIGKNQEVSISALTAAMGENGKRVVEDLQDMLDEGVLPTGYIDLAEGMLVLSDAGLTRTAPEPKAEPEPEPVKKTVEDENAILQEIREVNDAIPDEAMSAKIDRIGEITGKILDYQRSHPSKSGQLRSFLNYYLPTTLKILRAYAQLDAQGIEGENITAAKKRIESMMDMVVNGFESQLDKLFADDALDITSDVAVLENMLRKDGLSGDGMILDTAQAPAGEGAFSSQQAYLDLQKVADELENQKKADQDDGQITLSL